MAANKPTLSQILSESTLVPLSFVVLLGGIVFWASSLAARTDALTERLGKVETKQAGLVEMQEQLSAVQTKVDMIYDRIRLHEAAGMIGPPKKPLPKN